MIAIVDLDIGNFANVEKALSGRVTKDRNVIARADKLVLPGVGNFGEAARSLKGLRDVILERIESGVPFLGICLGMQLLFPASSEAEGNGLGLFRGEVKRLPRVAAPHIGWNQVFPRGKNEILADVPSGSYFYFVHSFYVKPVNREYVIGTTEYEVNGEIREFPSAVRRDNVYGVQFHPEKSSKKGLRVLQNFKEL